MQAATRRTTGRRRGAPASAVLAASGALAIGMVPLFLVGALSGPIGDDLGFGTAGTGAAIAVFFVTGGVTAVPVGWATERLGAPNAMRVGVVMSGLATLAIAGPVHSWLQLAVALGVAGIAIALVDTGASAWFADTVPAERHGAAFGVKEASVPSASLLAGLSIPLLADDLGWRAAFVLGALLAPLVWVLVPRGAVPSVPATDVARPAIRWGPLVLFAGGVALGTGSATAAATFLVPSFEDAGWSSGAAGVVLGVASAASIAVRLVLGRLSDRRPGSTWGFVGTAMAIGSIGAAVLAAAGEGAAGVLAGVVVLGAGWGWTGVAFHAVLVATLDSPALGAGVVLTGLSLGGAAGPAAFGAVADGATYGWAWSGAAGALALASALTASARWWQAPPGSRRGWPRTQAPAAG